MSNATHCIPWNAYCTICNPPSLACEHGRLLIAGCKWCEAAPAADSRDTEAAEQRVGLESLLRDLDFHSQHERWLPSRTTSAYYAKLIRSALWEREYESPAASVPEDHDGK